MLFGTANFERRFDATGGNCKGNGNATQFEETYWVDVVSGKPVRYERKDLRVDGALITHEVGQLMSFENAGNPNRD
jgi:hypothetical protein